MSSLFKKSYFPFLVFSITIFCLLLVFIGCGHKEETDIFSDNIQIETESSSIETSSEENSTEESALPVPPAGELLNTLSIDEKINQLFIITPEALTNYSLVTRAGVVTKNALAQHPVGGIIFFASNLLNTDQCSTMIHNMQEYSKINLFIATDEEGGTVSRLGCNPNINVQFFENMQSIGVTGNSEKAHQVGLTLGSQMKALGFNLDFAPVADVNSNPINPIIGVRSFGNSPELVSSMVSSCVHGFQESGIMCTLKHFPGHGDSSTDSHAGDVLINKTRQQLYDCELQPFISGIQAGAPFIMTGHLIVPGLTDSGLPATLSYDVITKTLRQELGYNGIIITDALCMQAITKHFDSAEASVRALEAGVDMILMPENFSLAVSGIKNALTTGRLTEDRINESVLRILETKYRYGIQK